MRALHDTAKARIAQELGRFVRVEEAAAMTRLGEPVDRTVQEGRHRGVAARVGDRDAPPWAEHAGAISQERLLALEVVQARERADAREGARSEREPVKSTSSSSETSRDPDREAPRRLEAGHAHGGECAASPSAR